MILEVIKVKTRRFIMGKNKPNILLLESITPQAMDLLDSKVNILSSDSPFSGGAIAQENAITAIITRGKGDVSKELIALCPDLKIIARCGVGLDNINVAFATQKKIKVVNAPGSNADTVAEHTLALMLMLQRNLFNSIEAVKSNDWDFRKNYVGDEIRGKSLGILGLGNIGKKVAKLATAFGMKINYWRGHSDSSDYQKLSFQDLLQQSDIISLHLPLVQETKHLIGEKELASMPNHALIINTSRGAIIEEKALINALQQKEIGGFAADVLEIEPPEKENLLLQFSNALITPHSASLTSTTYNNMCVMTVQNVLDLLEGKKIEDRFIFNKLPQ